MLDNGPNLSPLGRFVSGTFCILGCFVPWDVLSLGKFCPLGRFVPGKFWPLGRFVPGTFCPWDVLYVHRFSLFLFPFIAFLFLENKFIINFSFPLLSSLAPVNLTLLCPLLNKWIIFANCVDYFLAPFFSFIWAQGCCWLPSQIIDVRGVHRCTALPSASCSISESLGTS